MIQLNKMDSNCVQEQVEKFITEGDLCGAVDELKKAIEANPAIPLNVFSNILINKAYPTLITHAHLKFLEGRAGKTTKTAIDKLGSELANQAKINHKIVLLNIELENIKIIIAELQLFEDEKAKLEKDLAATNVAEDEKNKIQGDLDKLLATRRSTITLEKRKDEQKQIEKSIEDAAEKAEKATMAVAKAEAAKDSADKITEVFKAAVKHTK